MKPFDTLRAVEIAELTPEEIASYVKETGDENLVLQEVAGCRKRLDEMGMTYRK